MFTRVQMFNRAKALFSTRLLVLLDKYKEDFISQLVAESIIDALHTLYADNDKFDWMQRDKKTALNKIKEGIWKNLNL